MKLKTFHGGVHPPDYKELAKDKEVVTAPLPQSVIIPLAQHIGAPCEAVVAVGDLVKTGQIIGESKGFVSAPVYASISGKVIKVGECLHPVGVRARAVTIESDGKDEWVETIKANKDYQSKDAGELRSMVQKAGIVGLGGAAFPTHVKLSPPKEKKIDTLIVNGVECEPYLTADYRLMLERTADIIDGLKITMKILGVDKAFIGIEANKPKAIEVMKEAVAQMPGIEVVALKVKYPQGGEKQLIKAILNREVPPPPGLPMDVGVVVQNVGTLVAILEAVKYNKPLVERIVTVTGSGIKEPKNLKVRIGTLFTDLIEECGGFVEPVGKVIMGGPMMGIAQSTNDVPVIKGTSGILVLREDEVKAEEPQPCIKCGNCIRHCPMGIMTNVVADFIEHDMFEEAEKYNVMDCIECGSCVYICPAKRPLVHLVKYAKMEINAKRAQKK